MSVTIAEFIDQKRENKLPFQLGIFRGEICKVSGIIRYKQDKDDRMMMKLSVADKTGSVVCLVYAEDIMEELTNADEKKMILKCSNFRVSDDLATIIIGKKTEVSVLSRNTIRLTDDERRDAIKKMYAPMTPIKTVIRTYKSPQSTKRISLTGEVKMVHKSSGPYQPRKLVLSDNDGEESLNVLMWAKKDIPIKKGDHVLIYDVKPSSREGDDIDVDFGEGSHLEIDFPAPDVETTLKGSIVGLTSNHGIEFLPTNAAEDDNEQRFNLAANILLPAKDTLPLECTITITNLEITEIK